jgi:lipopolysaccharide transport system ATP-binding protein
MRGLGDTESVLAGYEAHVRSQNQVGNEAQLPVATGQTAAVSAAVPALPLGERAAALVSVHVANLSQDTPPRLLSPDLTITLTARMAGTDYPSLGVMIEQANGVGISSAGTHADGVQPRSLGDGLWQTTVTFAALPLHTGEYVLSVYLFDSAGLVVYEEWPDCARFLHVFGKSTPGLVRLPHVWS